MTVGPPAPTEAIRRRDGAELADLLRRVAARDSAAFAALYKQTSAKLYGVVARILTRGDASGEVLQEVYVRIWEKAGDYDADKGLADRLDGDHRPQSRARRNPPRSPRLARGHAGRIRAGGRGGRSARPPATGPSACRR